MPSLGECKHRGAGRCVKMNGRTKTCGNHRWLLHWLFHGINIKTDVSDAGEQRIGHLVSCFIVVEEDAKVTTLWHPSPR